MTSLPTDPAAEMAALFGSLPDSAQASLLSIARTIRSCQDATGRPAGRSALDGDPISAWWRAAVTAGCFETIGSDWPAAVPVTDLHLDFHGWACRFGAKTATRQRWLRRVTDHLAPGCRQGKVALENGARTNAIILPSLADARAALLASTTPACPSIEENHHDHA